MYSLVLCMSIQICFRKNKIKKKKFLKMVRILFPSNNKQWKDNVKKKEHEIVTPFSSKTYPKLFYVFLCCCCCCCCAYF